MATVQVLRAKVMAVKPRLGTVVLRAPSGTTYWGMRRNAWSVQHLCQGLTYTFSIDAAKCRLNAWAAETPDRAQVKVFLIHCGADPSLAKDITGTGLLADAPKALRKAGAPEEAVIAAGRTLPAGFTALSKACLRAGASQVQIEEIYTALLDKHVSPTSMMSWLADGALELAEIEGVSASFNVLNALTTNGASPAERARAALLCLLKTRELNGHTGQFWGDLSGRVAGMLKVDHDFVHRVVFPGSPKIDDAFSSINKVKERGTAPGTTGKFIARRKTAKREDLCASGLLRQSRRRLPMKLPLAEHLPSNWTDEQRAAAEHIATHPLTILVGPAGSGKTTVAKTAADLVARSGGEVALTAVTGKAAKVLDRKHGQTLHSFLGALPGDMSTRSKCRDVSLLVVDEVSMLDAMLASPLGAYLKADKADHVVLVGDPYQIPPVGPGAVLRDLMASPLLARNVVRLNEVKRTRRTGRNDILALSEHIRSNRLAAALEDGTFDIAASTAIEVVPLSSDREAIAKGVVAMVGDDYEDVLVIAPEYNSPLGVYALNRLLRDRHLGVSDEPWLVGERVIQCENRKLDETVLANGTFGEITEVRDDGSLMVHYPDEGLKVEYQPQEVLHGRGVIEPAYALTVHRSQGSEADHVVVVVDPEYGRMWANPGLGYTAVTRAKKRLTIIGDVATLAGIPTTGTNQGGVSAVDDRETDLRERLVLVDGFGAEKRTKR